MSGIEPEDHVPEVREPAGYRHADADVARELRECLADDVGLDSHGIEVAVRNGEVTLSGTVRHWADMQRAEERMPVPCRASSRYATICSRKEPLPSPGPEEEAGAAAKMGKPGYER